jgi:hypothetical protein
MEIESAISACAAGSSSPVVSSGSGIHSPTYSSRWTRADFSSSSASRVTTVVVNACGDRIGSPDSIARWTRSSAS